MPPRELIAHAPELVKELRAFRIATDPSHPIHPEICDRAATALEKFIELGEVMRAGRYAFSNLSDRGATILDFFNVWLDQERHRVHGLEHAVADLRAKLSIYEPLEPGSIETAKHKM